MLRYQQGESRAFEVLVQRHRRPIFNFVLRYLKDRSAAEDVTQDCFLRAVDSADTFVPGRFTTWIFMIARNLCVDVHRRQRIRATESLDAPLRNDPLVSRMEVTATGSVGVDQQASDLELAARMQSALSELPEEQREIFLLREVGGLQIGEIAVVVGVPENTVKSRLRYALDKLRDALGKYRDVAEVAR